MYKCSTVNNRAAKDNTCINAATVSNHQSRLVFKKKTRPRSDEWLAHHLKQRQSGWTWWYVDSILLIESIDQLDRHKAPLRREREREKASREREKESKMITLDGHLTRPVVWYWRGSGQRVIRERAPSECVSVCSLKCVCLCVWIRACVCVERGNGKRGCKTLKSDVIRGAGQSSYWRAGTSYSLGPAFRQVCVDGS